MTMAPGRKRRGYLLEIILISILLFLLWSSFSQSGARTSNAHNDFQRAFSRGLNVQPMMLK